MSSRNRLLVIVAVVLAFMFAGIAVVVIKLRPPKQTPPADQALEDAFSPEYDAKVSKISKLLNTAPTSRPSPEDTNELIDEVLQDKDFRVRVRAMAVLPFLKERESAIDALIRCTHDRDSESNGEGNVPLYATTYLSEMHATRAIPDIEDWIAFLQHNPSYGVDHAMILKKPQQDLTALRRFASTQPSARDVIQGVATQPAFTTPTTKVPPPDSPQGILQRPAGDLLDNRQPGK